MPAREVTSVKANKKRVLLVDDHPMIRSGLAQVINQQKDIMVCCEAGNANDALQRVASSHPDLAVVDISLPTKSGLELINDLQALHPKLPVLVLSMHDELVFAERVLRAGARGYVMKHSGGEVVLEAIRTVLAGQIFVSDQMSALVLKAFSAGTRAVTRSPVDRLSDREFEVFKLMGEGCITRQIAERLHISPKTVDVYRQNLKEKLKLPTSTLLVQHAVRWVEEQNRA